MKTIGIFTLNDNLNYGNRLQNYAVQRILKQYGVPGNMNKRYESTNQMLKYLMWKCCPFIERFCNSKSFRVYRFLDFNKKMSYFGEKVKCDYYIYGSDQIWNPYYSVNSLISPITEVDKNIALSASVGVERIDEKYNELFRCGLEKFYAISVREKKAADIIKNFTNKGVQILIDPTMCLSCNEWRMVSKKPFREIPPRYMLLYFLGTLSEYRKKEIHEFAKLHNYQIINLKEKKWIDVVGPAEFLYLVDHASYFLTDSFHGCVFSILFQTQFATMKREDNDMPMNSRIDHLLSLFGLEKRKIEYFVECNSLIDFSTTEIILKKEQRKVIEYLEKFLL